jgi:hypothetical protein
MNLGTILQTIIATVIIYLIFSLLASEIQENVSTLFELRAKRLRKSIQKMFGENRVDEPLTTLLYNHPDIASLNQSAYSWLTMVGISFNYPSWEKWKKKEEGNIESAIIFALVLIALIVFTFIFPFWPLAILILVTFIAFRGIKIREESRNTKNSCKKNCRKSIGPSYISDSALFASTVTSIIKNNNISETEFPELKNFKEDLMKLSGYMSAPPDASVEVKLKTLENDSGHMALVFLMRVAEDSEYKWDVFNKKLEDLFNEAQKRSSGVFKRNAKGLSLIIGLLLSFFTNADFFKIINRVGGNNQNLSAQILANVEPVASQLFPQKAKEGTEPKAATNELSLDQKAVVSKLLEAEGVLPFGWDLDIQDNTKSRDELLKILSLNCNGTNTRISQCTDALLQSLGESSYLIPDFKQRLKDNSPRFAVDLEELIKYNYPEKEIDFSEAYTEILDDLNKQKTSVPLAENKSRDEAFQLLNENKINCLDSKEDRVKSKCLRKIKEKSSVMAYININYEKLNFEMKIKQHSKYMDDLEVFTKALKKIQQKLSEDKLKSQLDVLNGTNTFSVKFINNNIDKQGGLLKVLFGWLISGIAISMGAPFWFDILGRVMNVRNAGAPITKQK